MVFSLAARLCCSMPAMTLRALTAALPLVLASAPLAAMAAPNPSSLIVPFNPASPAVRSQLDAVQTDTVELFDPIARARSMASTLPRRWSGTYEGYGATGGTSVRLDLDSLSAVGQMVVLKGRMTIGSLSTPVQGNLNAKSDQLDLLLLGDTAAAGLEPGGLIQGLQSFELSAWEAPRLTNPGGKLVLSPVAGRF